MPGGVNPEPESTFIPNEVFTLTCCGVLLGSKNGVIPGIANGKKLAKFNAKLFTS